MVEFETIKSEEVKFGTNNFLEIARKKAITEDGENMFISMSRGFFDKMGNRRYRKSISLPLTSEVVDFVVAKVKEMGEGAKPEPKKAEPTEEPQEEAKTE